MEQLEPGATEGRTWVRRTILGALISVLAAPAWAADGGVSVELNKLEPSGGACRAYLVLENKSERAFETLKLDLVMFGADGIVANRLAVETAPLPGGKTSLKVFEIDALPCDGIGRVLLNDVMACADETGARADCLDLVTPSARGDAGFIK